MKTSRVIMSTLAASAVGVAIGMLYAPQKGTRTRRKIVEKNHQYVDYLADMFDDIIDTVSHPIENLGNGTQRIAKKAKETIKK
jgi:gas vesicle protein